MWRIGTIALSKRRTKSWISSCKTSLMTIPKRCRPQQLTSKHELKKTCSTNTWLKLLVVNSLRFRKPSQTKKSSCKPRKIQNLAKCQSIITLWIMLLILLNLLAKDRKLLMMLQLAPTIQMHDQFMLQ